MFRNKPPRHSHSHSHPHSHSQSPNESPSLTPLLSSSPPLSSSSLLLQQQQQHYNHQHYNHQHYNHLQQQLEHQEQQQHLEEVHEESTPSASRTLSHQRPAAHQEDHHHHQQPLHAIGRLRPRIRAPWRRLPKSNHHQSTPSPSRSPTTPATPRIGVVSPQMGRHTPSTPTNSLPRTLSASSFAVPDVESVCNATPPPSTTFTPDFLAAGAASAAAATTAAVTVTAVTATTTTSTMRRAVPRPSDCGRSESVSDESFSVTDKRVANTPSNSTSSSQNNKNNRFNPLHRISAIFKESDGRCEENLRSTKRRVVQVRRQPDSAPVRFQMGFRSRTGWEPIRATKENQDCLVALVPWGPGSRFNFFAALDGHGRHGHRCAIFIAERVVSYLKRHLVPLASHDMVANAMHRAIAYAERRLEAYEAMDFSVSGSTGVFVIVHGTSLFCANVGDSRAILGREMSKGRPRRSMTHSDPDDLVPSRSRSGSRPNRQYVPVPLSFDQKPVRPDEKERLLACGARVDAWESIDVGEERVWLPDIRTPGLAVSRSFGDLILKPYGVNATPEVYSLELCEEDRFVVMGSDGVFEFISTEEVTEIVGRWRDNGSAQDAAEELVRCATDRWIDDDSVIDDISCVVVFMNVVAPEIATPQEPQFVQTKGGRHEPPVPTTLTNDERKHDEHDRRYSSDPRDVPNRTNFDIASVNSDPSKSVAGFKGSLDRGHDEGSDHSDDAQDIISTHSNESM